MASDFEVSVVIPTYNRAAMLRNTVNSVLQQDCRPTFEIVIVDNNSRDDTKAVVDALIAEHPGRVRYVLETKQGNAHARNRGVEEAKGAIVAFVDDDVTVERDWLRSAIEILQLRPELSFVGGRVLPQWNERPPAWLTEEHWAPLALLDYGTDELPISGNSPRGLLTANLALRRSVFEEVGMFSPDLQRVKNRIGSMEDHEFLLRVCRSGKEGIYTSRMTALAPVEVDRLTRSYHRRWHKGHGHFYAVMGDPEFERSKFQLLGVPSHLYKQSAADVLKWLAKTLTGNSDRAFAVECRLRFFYGFFLQRARRPSTGSRD
jgi:glycosyltransferase involved in cell wall biosynthesis